MNVVNEKNCKDGINAFTYEDWQPLLALIPEIERTSGFGEWIGFNKNKFESGLILKILKSIEKEIKSKRK